MRPVMSFGPRPASARVARTAPAREVAPRLAALWVVGLVALAVMLTFAP